MCVCVCVCVCELKNFFFLNSTWPDRSAQSRRCRLGGGGVQLCVWTFKNMVSSVDQAFYCRQLVHYHCGGEAILLLMISVKQSDKKMKT